MANSVKPANPFNLLFGQRPETFVGRDAIVDTFIKSLEQPGDPNRATIITGIRGSGKTALLSDVSENLDKSRFLVINTTAGDGMLLDILDEFAAKGKRWLGKKLNRIQGFSAGALGFSFGINLKDDSQTHGFRYFAAQMLEELQSQGITTVFLIDEVHMQTPEMRVFALTYQHLLREHMDIALMMAGLPDAVLDILNDRVLTFLRRAQQVELEEIDTKVFELTYIETFEKAGINADTGVLQTAAKAAQGYPYLFQLIGYYLYKHCNRKIAVKDVQRALEYAKVELFRNVHSLIYRDLSDKDRTFLHSMAILSTSGRDVQFGDLVAGLAVTKGYASKYRQRLLESGLITAPAHGKLAFRLPYMQEYLLQHMDNEEL
jgi:hypothetical protein